MHPVFSHAISYCYFIYDRLTGILFPISSDFRNGFRAIHPKDYYIYAYWAAVAGAVVYTGHQFIWPMIFPEAEKPVSSYLFMSLPIKSICSYFLI